MTTGKAVIHSESGLHARPASTFVTKAATYASNITIEAKGKKVDAKSIVAVLTLGAVKGVEVIIAAEGSDEERAVSELVKLIEMNFEGQ